MTSQTNWGKYPIRRAGFHKAFVGALILGLLNSCTGQDSSSTQSDLPDIEVSSLDGRLHVSLPGGLIVHRHKHSIQATHPKGSIRYYMSHQASQKLIRLIGTAKSVLTKHSWEVSAERHFAQASELRFQRPSGSGAPAEVRTIWFVPADDRVVLCDGITTPDLESRLGDSFKRLCTNVRIQTRGPTGG
jgi:hypothetical protein